MRSSYEVKYWQDGKIYRSAKKNGEERKFKYAQYPILQMKNKLNYIIKKLIDCGHDDLNEIDALNSCYCYFDLMEQGL